MLLPLQYKKKNKKIIKIKNSVSFLNQFAKHKREKTLAKIIAITGSTGKTSLKKFNQRLTSKFWKDLLFSKIL